MRQEAETAGAFGVERLIAVCHSLLSSHDGVARRIDSGEVLSQVSARVCGGSVLCSVPAGFVTMVACVRFIRGCVCSGCADVPR